MRKLFLFFFPFFLLIGIRAASAGEPSVLVAHGERYMCGDSFEITIPDQPATTSQVTRASSVQAEAGPDERLLTVRVMIRNLTSSVFTGIAPESFLLTGYVRDRSLSYTPEVMQSYDYTYGSSGSSYTSADRFMLPPLRMEDILLVYRVNPILINWELHIQPQAASELTLSYGGAEYPEMDPDPCDGIFQFYSIRNAETGEIIKYLRDENGPAAVSIPVSKN